MDDGMTGGWVPDCATSERPRTRRRRSVRGKGVPRATALSIVVAVLVGAVGVVLVAAGWGDDAVAAPLPSLIGSEDPMMTPMGRDPAASDTTDRALTTRATIIPAQQQLSAASPPDSKTAGGTKPSRPAPTAAASVDPPVREQVPNRPWRDNTVVVPAVGISAPLVTMSADGAVLTPPADVRIVGVWDRSAAIDGATGTVLLSGHVDNVHQGRGALWPLHRVRRGDRIYVMLDGMFTEWEVARIRAVPKAELPQEVFAGARGPRRLVLVTCGGVVEHDAAGHGHYADNVIVTASPVDGDRAAVP